MKQSSNIIHLMTLIYISILIVTVTSALKRKLSLHQLPIMTNFVTFSDAVTTSGSFYRGTLNDSGGGGLYSTCPLP